jgi:tetratricopeptide (TPR) repeat protein
MKMRSWWVHLHSPSEQTSRRTVRALFPSPATFPSLAESNHGKFFSERVSVNRKWIVLLVCFLIARNSFADAALLFKNGLWYTGTDFTKKDFYSVNGVLESEFDGEVNRVIDLKGGYVIPPLSDAHSHALGWKYGIDDQNLQFLERGVFYVMNPNNIQYLTDEIKSKLNTPESVDVIWANGGLTSTGGHPAQIYEHVAKSIGASPDQMRKQAYFEIDSLADLKQMWKTITAGKPDVIKIYLENSQDFAKQKNNPDFYGKRGLDPALVPEIVRLAHENGLRVIAHIASGFDFRIAIASGVDLIAHLPLERLTMEDAQAAAARHVVIETTTMSHRNTYGIQDLLAIHTENLRLLKEAEVQLALGTDSDHSVVDEAENILKLGVLDTTALLKIATQDTALAIFPQRKIGSLADGYEASFLVLEESPLKSFSNLRKISLRVKNGHPLSFLPSIATPLAEEIKQNGIASAILLYRKVRLEKTVEYDFSEQQLNRLGYQLLYQDHRIPEAIRIFELNAQTYPHSANVYDSLGEAFMVAGDQEKAKLNYQKSLEFNPHNNNAIEALKKLQ